MSFSRNRQRASRRRLLLEPLEDRRLLATITVTSLTDGTLSQLAGDGKISLREAIQATNENDSVDGSVAGDPGIDNIVFESNLNGTIYLQAGPFLIYDALLLAGNGRTNTDVDAHYASRVFISLAIFQVEHMTIRRGRSTEPLSGGGAIKMSQQAALAVVDCNLWNNSTQGASSPGGALFSDDSVLIRDSDIVNNSTTNDLSMGGAIYSQGNIEIESSTITNNSTLGQLAHGGAITGKASISILNSHVSGNEASTDSQGGAIFGPPGSELVLSGSTLEDNTADWGGGAVYGYNVHSENSVIDSNHSGRSGGGVSAPFQTMNSTLVTGNSAAEDGGGLGAVDLVAWQSTFTNNQAHGGAGISTRKGWIRDSTISGNTATSNGGGIRASTDNSSERVTIINSTITQNKVQGDPQAHGGGGLFSGRSGAFTVSFSTIAGNTVIGTSARGGGIFGQNQPELLMLASIVAGNGSSSGAAPDLQINNVFSDEFASYNSIIGNNLDSPLTESNPNRDANGNLVGGPVSGIVDPLLGSLADRGGPTLTRSLSMVSPAVDFHNPAGALIPLNDQRGAGHRRNRDGNSDGTLHVDAGAFELGLRYSAVVSFQFETVAGAQSLRVEDLGNYDPSTNSWSLYFDGSDVGLNGTNIDAFYQDADGSILMSFGQIVTLPSLGEILPADIVRFVPTSLGTQTAGSFELVHSGFALGLDASIDNIDAIGRANDGRLVISTDNDVFLSFGVAQAHDLLAIDGTSLLPYFDGEQVGLDTADENITGVWFEPDTGLIFMTMQGTFNVDGLSGNAGDVIAFAPTSLEGDTTGKFYSFDSMPGMDLDQPLAGLDILYSDTVSTTIGDWVFEDLNRNGIQDIGEPGVEGVFIELLDSAGQVLASTASDMLGRYQFADLVAGDYLLRIEVPTGYLLTAADQGSDDMRDSDFQPLTQTTSMISIAPGAVDTSLDAGLIRILDGDFNDDGLYDCLDIDALVAAIAATANDAGFDLTGDGLVDLADRDAWLAEAGAVNLGVGKVYLLGDATLDGVVDGQDFIRWNTNKFNTGAGWCGGDFTADGVTDGQDFIRWNTNKFTGSDAMIIVIPDLTPRADGLHGIRAQPEEVSDPSLLCGRQFDGMVAIDDGLTSARLVPPASTCNFDARILSRASAIDNVDGIETLNQIGDALDKVFAVFGA